MTRRQLIAYTLAALASVPACKSTASQQTHPTRTLADCGRDSCVTAETSPSPDNATPFEQSGPTVRVGLYPAIPGEQTACKGDPKSMIIEFDTSQDCYGWRRTVDPSTGSGVDPRETTRDNSAACMLCYENALCYREYTASLVCDAPFPEWQVQQSTDKFITTTSCEPDGGGDVRSQIIDRAENCPPAPEGYDREACLDELEEKCDPIHEVVPLRPHFPSPSAVEMPPFD